MRYKKIILITCITLVTLTAFHYAIKQKNSSKTVTNITPGTNITTVNHMVHRQGTKIVNDNGEEIIFKGINLEGWLMWQGVILNAGLISESKFNERLIELAGKEEAGKFKKGVYQNFVTKEDIKKIKEYGFNSVRLPINHTLIENNEGYKYIDNLLEWSKEYDIYVILDLHAAPGGQSNVFVADPDLENLWNSNENKQKTIQIWSEIAQRYKDEKQIAGYDLLNEPDPDNKEDLINLYKQIISAIRQHDKNHLIIIEGTNFSSEFNFFNKLLDENQAFTFHSYNLIGKDKTKELISEYSELSTAFNAPFFNSEFGANNHEWINSVVSEIENKELSGWFFWNWKNTQNNNEKYKNLLIINSPPSWEKVAKWISWPYFPNTKPTQQETIEAMNDLIEAIKIQNTTLDKQTLDILLNTK